MNSCGDGRGVFVFESEAFSADLRADTRRIEPVGSSGLSQMWIIFEQVLVYAKALSDADRNDVQDPPRGFADFRY